MKVSARVSVKIFTIHQEDVAMYFSESIARRCSYKMKYIPHFGATLKTGIFQKHTCICGGRAQRREVEFWRQIGDPCRTRPKVVRDRSDKQSNH